MSNSFSRFRSLLPSATNELVDIISNNGDGTSTAATLSGQTVVVKGESVSPNNRAYVRDGEVVRAMPQLPVLEVEV